MTTNLLRPLAALALLMAWLPCGSAAADAWVPPLAPLVVRRAFDPPDVRWGAGHRGVDLAGHAGAVVRAAGAGVVTYAAVLAGRGVVVVRHGVLRTTYEPVRALARVGAAVGPGSVVGLLAAGHAGHARPGEALLHWGLLRDETYLDPLSLLRREPSRLVPVAPASPAPPPDAPPDLSWPPWSMPPPPAATGGATPLAAPARAAPSSATAPLALGGTAVAGVGAAAVALARRPRPRSRGSP